MLQFEIAEGKFISNYISKLIRILFIYYFIIFYSQFKTIQFQEISWHLTVTSCDKERDEKGIPELSNANPNEAPLIKVFCSSVSTQPKYLSVSATVDSGIHRSGSELWWEQGTGAEPRGHFFGAHTRNLEQMFRSSPVPILGLVSTPAVGWHRGGGRLWRLPKAQWRVEIDGNCRGHSDFGDRRKRLRNTGDTQRPMVKGVWRFKMGRGPKADGELRGQQRVGRLTTTASRYENGSLSSWLLSTD